MNIWPPLGQSQAEKRGMCILSIYFWCDHHWTFKHIKFVFGTRMVLTPMVYLSQIPHNQEGSKLEQSLVSGMYCRKMKCHLHHLPPGPSSDPRITSCKNPPGDSSSLSLLFPYYRAWKIASQCELQQAAGSEEEREIWPAEASVKHRKM